jgi:hypothetical protein
VGQRLRRWYADQWISLDGSAHSRAENVPIDPQVCAAPHTRDAAMSDAGMSTVEYAVGTVVAAAFAAVLYKIVTGDSVVAGLTSLVNSAMHTSL